MMGLVAGYLAWYRSSRPPDPVTPDYSLAPAPATWHDERLALDRLESRLAELELRLGRLESQGPAQARNTTVADPDMDDLRQRLESVEAQLRRMPDGRGGILDQGSFLSERNNYTPEEENQKRLDALNETFQNDDNADPALQADLESAAPLFDTDELAVFEFSQIDCSANYCRLVYQDNSGGSAEGAIAENELHLLLTEKYGDEITIRDGERDGRSKSIYIELDSR